MLVRYRNRGFSLLEILLSSGLLLLLTTMAFSAVVPALQREDWFEKKQVDVRSYLIAKERVTSLLRGVQLQSLESNVDNGEQVLVSFFRPFENATSSFGELSTFDLSESVRFDDSVTYEIRHLNSGLLVSRNANSGEQRPIWNLGSDSEVSVELSADKRRLDFHFEGPELERFSDGRWQFDFSTQIF